MSTFHRSGGARPVGVVGAGLSGIVCAHTLHRAGIDTVVFDEADRVGGRLATEHLGAGRLDGGAQFFTARTDAFRSEVDRWMADGQVGVWCHGFGEQPDGHLRFAAFDGMQSLVEHLAAELPDVRLGQALEVAAPGWAGDERVDALVLTAPTPRSLAVLNAGRTDLDELDRAILSSLDYHPTLAVLATLDGPSGVPEPGAAQDIDPLFSFVADNHLKGVSEVPALTLHVNHPVSAARWDEPDDPLLEDLLERARPWFHGARVEHARLLRWRHATPVITHHEPCLRAKDLPEPVLFAGDAFAGPRVEGAWRSGRAAADRVLQALGRW